MNSPQRHREQESGRAGERESGRAEVKKDSASSPLLSLPRSLCLRVSVAILILYVALLSGCAASEPSSQNPEPADTDQIDARIAFYEKKIADHPTVAAAHAKLGVSYLQKAKETHDVDWLRKAREATERSIKIQPSLEAYRTMAAICSFAHQFACAVEWGQKAVRTYSQDFVSAAILADGYLRTGRPELAIESLNLKGSDAENSYELAEARGLIFSELGRMDEAREQYKKAQLLAIKRRDRTSEVRAKVNLAGTYIDTERATEARAILAEIRETNGISKTVRDMVQLHRAELAELDKNYDQALRLYEELGQGQNDPDLYRKCYHLALTIGDEAKAKAHFKKSEDAGLMILSKGEEFSLECLANLYAEAGVNLEQAEKYALRNLEFKQDKSAQETLNYVRQRTQQ
jgi:tetratricopeptide (TPR) repeat protein